MIAFESVTEKINTLMPKISIYRNSNGESYMHIQSDMYELNAALPIADIKDIRVTDVKKLFRMYIREILRNS